MMRFDILTLFPEIFPNVLNSSILGRAVKKNLLSFNFVNIRDFSNDIHGKVDDYPYGGGCGMLMQAQPIYDAYKSVVDPDEKKPLTVFLSPRGRKFDQEIAKEMVQSKHIVLICGHYEGIDQRVIDEISDFELSIGDYVLTGGELGAMVVCDAVSRMVPGVLSEEAGFVCESHYNGLLEYPQYTRPPVWHDRKVPDVLLSGHQENIDAWRHEKALQLTENVRPDLYYSSNNLPLSAREITSKEVAFELIGFSLHNQDDIFKKKRKLLQKLRRKGYMVQDDFKVYNCHQTLNEKLKGEHNFVVISDETTDSIHFENPALWIANEHDTGSIYPSKLKWDDDNTIYEEISRFLSISHIVKKFSKI